MVKKALNTPQPNVGVTMRAPEELLHEQREWLRVTLASIGDAVITTDTNGEVTFLNPIAETLTGWKLDEALGASLQDVFRIVNEETRQTVENPATRALRNGVVVGLANHTLLIAKGGQEYPIDDSAAPIRDGQGAIAGVVLVFRDVTERRRNEKQLRESEERFRLLVTAVKDYAIFMLDPQGIVASWNAGAEQIKGYKAEEIIGRHFSCFYPADAIAADFPAMELKAATAVGRFEDEGWRLRKDGSRLWANVVITALRDESGTLKGFAKVTRDLTERRAAEEALRSREERFRALNEYANDAIVTADQAGNIVSWNRAATTIFGYALDEAIGQPLTLIMPESFREAYQIGWERLRSTGVARLIGKTVELEGRRKDGKQFPLELSLGAWNAAEGQFISGIIRDITDRKQLERAKMQAEVLVDLNRRKDEFLAMLSHELRNPLAPISTAVQLLRLKNDDATRQQAMPLLERQVANLTRLVDDLLDVSRISTGRIRLHTEKIDLRIVAERAVDAMRSLVFQRSHELSLSLGGESIWVNADPLRLEQVAINLLSNAVKYTNLGGKIRLAVERTDNEAVLRIKDTGVGISPELLPSVFDLFTQADCSLDRAHSGLGVGLTIVKRIVEMHGGKVEAASAGLGHGSEFVVRLPLAETPTTKSNPISNTTGDLGASKLRVLVVDDNKDAADSLAMLLRTLGHDVLVVHSGIAALTTGPVYLPDVALLDIGMPEMDGYELARLLREQPQFHDIRLVALTGYGRDADQQRSHSAGFSDHLVKPAQFDALRNLLASVTPRAAN
jgi:PAS domain S-box-containing protein